MNKKLKKTKNIIILGILILIVIIIVCCIAIKKNNLQEENNIEQTEENEIKLSEELDVNNVYNIEKCINKYLNGVEDNSDIIKKLEFEEEDDFYIKNAYIIEVNSKNTLYFVNGTLISSNLINTKTDEREKKALDDCLVPKKKIDDKQLHPYFNLDLI